MSGDPVPPAAFPPGLARAAGLERALERFPDDVAAAWAAAMANRAMLPPPPSPELEPWRPLAPERP